jgi:hypothetical protein
MRKLYPKAKYDIADNRTELVTVSDAFVVIKVDEQEMVMPRDQFEQQAKLVRRWRHQFIYGVFGATGALESPQGSNDPPTVDGIWCIDLDKVPEEAWVSGWNP